MPNKSLFRARPRRRARLLTTSIVVAALGALALGACSGGDDGSEPESTTTQAETTSTATTVAPTTTRVTSTTAAPTTSTTSTTEPLPTTPLNGLPVYDPGAPTRPALVVKIDNRQAARPQSGLNLADIVYEENVEGWTRFAAVFHSLVPDPVGPVRSGRTQDIDLLSSLDRPLFVWSGGNARVTDAIRASTLVDMGPYGLAGIDYYRSSDRRMPHNFYARPAGGWAANPAGSPPPRPQLTFRAAGEEADGDVEIAGVKLQMDGGMRARWEWDPAAGVFWRFHENSPHTVADGTQIDASNVVVLTVQYRPSPADARSPEAVTTGEGDALVLTDGQAYLARWHRADQFSPWTFTNADGDEIRLTPGRTWIELTRGDQAAIVPAGVDAASVPWP
ncbi:MAG: DUF3048 domain-containing protein [Ilumatobacteraceae bacterium]|nr:MAG: DUF3048 domain-containing protein [Actinomycetota bacterium]